MEITLIMAASENGVIGRDNKLPWHLPADLRHFVRHTKGKTLLMGRRTYDSLEPTPSRPNPLPERRILVVTARPGEFPFEADDVIPVGSVQEGLAMAEALGVVELMVAGGHSVYMEAWPWADRIRLTRVHADLEGDTFIGEPDGRRWEVVESQPHSADERNPYDYSFILLERRREPESESGAES